jgi:prepilin-type N-terminal cleavage/methylation domain-containing protein
MSYQADIYPFLNIWSRCSRKTRRRRNNGRNERGFSLLEVLVASILITMVAAMIYSVLNVGIKFSHQGEVRLQAIARQQGFLSLLQQQISSALYDPQRRKMEISADGETLRLVTRAPLLFPDLGVVLAFYRYRPEERTVYYTELIDYYNPDFDEEYKPDFDQMYTAVSTDGNFLMEYDEETGEILVDYEDNEYIFRPRCWPGKT